MSRAAAAARLADLIERHEAVATSIGLGFYPPAYDVVVAGGAGLGPGGRCAMLQRDGAPPGLPRSVARPGQVAPVVRSGDRVHDGQSARLAIPSPGGARRSPRARCGRWTAQWLAVAALACGRGRPATDAREAGPGGASDPSPPVDAPALGEGPWLRRAGDLAGYVDFSGAWVIAPTFAIALPFEAGLAVVKTTASSPVRYIDVTGAPAFPLEFENAASFERSVALVTTLDGSRAVLTRAGALILKGEIDRMCGAQVSEELFMAAKDDECGVYDLSGRRVVSAPDIGWISPVLDGRVLVATGVETFPDSHGEENIWAAHFAAYDLSGRLVQDFSDVAAIVMPGASPLVTRSLRERLSSLRSLADVGYLPVWLRAERSPGDGNTELGYIRLTGQRIRPEAHVDLCCLSEGWIGYQDARDGLWGVETLAGDRRIPPVSLVPTGFSEGLLAVVQPTEEGARFLYLDTQGVQAIPGTWAYAADFHEGRAAAAREDGPGGPVLGLIDTQGAWVVPPRFWIIDPFERGRQWTTATDVEGRSFVVSRAGVVLPLPATLPQD